jgi:hypothetical protein
MHDERGISLVLAQLAKENQQAAEALDYNIKLPEEEHIVFEGERHEWHHSCRNFRGPGEKP